MRVLIVSTKRCWKVGCDPERFGVTGGFAQQVESLAVVFGRLNAILMLARGPAVQGFSVVPNDLVGVSTLPEPLGAGWIRKVALVPWMALNGGPLWREIKIADAIHVPVPGDIGVLAIIAALTRRKPLFVRHCGTWGDRSTLANRFLAWLLPRIAGGRVVVMATGGGPEPPEPCNSAIQWIFATSLSEAEIEGIVPASAWLTGEPLRLVTVGRLTVQKNARACVEALPAIRQEVPESTLRVVGDGPFWADLEAVARRCGVADAVTFTGNLNHEAVIETLCRSHLFLFPTRVAEGFPKAVLEAMACGLPVVASPVSVLPHLLADGCGELLAGTSAEDVAEAVIQLAGDPGRMSAMGRAARGRARGYTLERWRDLIGERLEAAWGRPLNDGARYDGRRAGAAK